MLTEIKLSELKAEEEQLRRKIETALKKKQVIDLEGLKGKTILAVEDFEANLVFVFTDDTFLHVTADIEDESPFTTKRCPVGTYISADSILSTTGIVPPEEGKRLIAVRDALWENGIERWERDQYLRLKAKFEGEPNEVLEPEVQPG